MKRVIWRVHRISLPMSWDPPRERLIEVDLRATWEDGETLEGEDAVTPGLTLTFWLPERSNQTLAQIEEAAFRYARNHLPRFVAALPLAQT